MIAASPVDQIKEKLDIVEVVRSYIPLIPAGKNFKAVCPFHKEKTPSFIVSPERQTWHCFGACSEGGDIFTFVMKHDHLEFYEALRVLAERAGIELKSLSPSQQKQFGVLYDINEAAKGFFIRALRENDEAKAYLASRGLRPETLDQFEVGFASEESEALILHLLKSKYAASDIERAGLSVRGIRGGYADRFRGRIMFPLFNHFGKTVGFSGRILPRLDDGKSGKYVNSPETQIFSKSRLLYGYHLSKRVVKEKEEVVVVEGQMDLLMLHQDGVKNVVATSGTALTHDHIASLKRAAKSIVFFLDNDEAGGKAVERGIALASANDFSAKVVALDEYKDPAEAVQKKPGIVAEAVSRAIPAMEFYFKTHLKDFGGGVATSREFPALKEKIRLVLVKIRDMQSGIERSYWLRELSKRVGISETVLAVEMDQLRATPQDKLVSEAEMAPAAKRTLTRREMIAERMLSLVSLRDDFAPRIAGETEEELPPDYCAVFRSIRTGERVNDTRLKEIADFIALRSSLDAEVDAQKMEEEFAELLRQLKLEYLKERRAMLYQSIIRAEELHEDEKLVSILKEFDEVSRLMEQIHA